MNLKPISIILVLLLVISYKAFTQNLLVDVSRVIRHVPDHAVGINMNYLMDGTFINAGAQQATGDALKQMGARFLRYPGGEKSDNYLFSAPPYTSSAPRMALTGSCQWPSKNSNFINSDHTTAKEVVLDFDEFMTMCNQASAEPMIVVAYDAAYYGTGLNNPAPNPCGTKPTLAELITHAAEWVRYANIVKGYGIKYWCIGNESWGSCDYNGCVTPQQYAQDIVDFATAMKAVDPTIKIIVNGRGTNWWQTLLQNSSAAHIDYLGVSCYPLWNYTGGYEQYRTSNTDLLAEAKTAVDAINAYAVPADRNRIKVISTEFNAIDFNNAWINTNDLGHALVTFETMGRHLEHPQVEAALLWNTRWTNNITIPNQIYDALSATGGLNANGKALSIWGNHLLPTVVQSSFSGAGSQYLVSFAVYDTVTNKLNVFVINKDNIPRLLNLTLANYTSLPFCNRFEFKGTAVTDIAPLLNTLTLFPDQVLSYPFATTLSANSITVFQFEGHIVLPNLFNQLQVNRSAGNQAIIQWQTHGDQCGFRYTLQRSTDGITWENRQSFTNRCIKADQHDLQDDFTGTQAGIKIYYRISITDAHGKTGYSQVKSLEINTQTALSFSISPNPVADIMMLNVANGLNKAGSINIRNMDGKKIMSLSSVMLTTLVQINLGQLPAGLYMVEMIRDQERSSQQVFKK